MLLHAEKDTEQLVLSVTAGRNVKWYNYFGKLFGSIFKIVKYSILKKLNIYLPYNSAIPFLNIYPRKIKHMSVTGCT